MKGRSKCCERTQKKKRCSRNGDPCCMQHKKKYLNKVLVLGGYLFKKKIYNDAYISKLIGTFIHMKEERRIRNLKKFEFIKELILHMEKAINTKGKFIGLFFKKTLLFSSGAPHHLPYSEQLLYLKTFIYHHDHIYIPRSQKHRLDHWACGRRLFNYDEFKIIVEAFNWSEMDISDEEKKIISNRLDGNDSIDDNEI